MEMALGVDKHSPLPSARGHFSVEFSTFGNTSQARELIRRARWSDALLAPAPATLSFCTTGIQSVILAVTLILQANQTVVVLELS